MVIFTSNNIHLGLINVQKENTDTVASALESKRVNQAKDDAATLSIASH
jgi:hypothetical protein